MYKLKNGTFPRSNVLSVLLFASAKEDSRKDAKTAKEGLCVPLREMAQTAIKAVLSAPLRGG